MKMKNKLLITMFAMILFSVTLIIAPSSLGTVKQYDCLNLLQICDNCTWNNISSVLYPDKTTALGEVNMTRTNTEYNYYSCDDLTTQIGTYIVNGKGDLDGRVEVWSYDYEVTPSGFTGTLGFYILVLVLSLGIIVLGFYKEDAPIVILGSFGLYFLAIYILFNGIVGLKDTTTTLPIGIIILGIAMYISIRSGMELLDI